MFFFSFKATTSRENVTHMHHFQKKKYTKREIEYIDRKFHTFISRRIDGFVYLSVFEDLFIYGGDSFEERRGL